MGYKSNPSDFAPWESCCYNPQTEVCTVEVPFGSKGTPGCAKAMSNFDRSMEVHPLSSCGATSHKCRASMKCCTSMPSSAFPSPATLCTTLPCEGFCAASEVGHTCKTEMSCCQYKSNPSDFAPWESCCYNPQTEVCTVEVPFGSKGIPGCADLLSHVKGNMSFPIEFEEEFAPQQFV